ncbi:unnamed protein product, partial [Rotaria socialis]
MFSLLVNIPANATWTQNGVTIAGGHGTGGATNQLWSPHGLFVDDDQTVVIADHWSHRIMQWKNGDTTNGQIVAGGKGQGNRLHQLKYPTDVLIDTETDSLIICDRGNRRVVRWSRRSGTTQGEILIDNIDCFGLAMDEQRYLYVSDERKHEVRRYQLGEKNGTIVAGGNGKGNGTNQLNMPGYLVVDRDHSVYVSDNNNHRVMKWVEGATKGIVVAGGQGQGNALTQLKLKMSSKQWTLLYTAQSYEEAKDLAKSRFNVCQNRRSDLNDQTKYSFKCSEYRKYPLCHFQIKIIVPDNNMNSITIMSKNEHEHEQNERNTTTRLPSPIRESISNYVKCGLSQPQIKASLILNYPQSPIDQVKLSNKIVYERRRDRP